MFQDQFSLLRCLERECHKIDQLLSNFDETMNPALELSRPKATNSGIDAYDLSYFIVNPQRWSIKFGTWHANPFGADKSWKEIEMERLLASEQQTLPCSSLCKRLWTILPNYGTNWVPLLSTFKTASRPEFGLCHLSRRFLEVYHQE